MGSRTSLILLSLCPGCQIAVGLYAVSPGASIEHQGSGHSGWFALALRNEDCCELTSFLQS